MRIKIEPDAWGTLKEKQPIMLDEEAIGLRYVENSMRRIYDIIDEKLFFLAAIEYGILFKITKDEHNIH